MDGPLKSSSKNIVVSIKKYAKIIFPILQCTVFNRTYVLDRIFMPVHQIGSKDPQLDSEKWPKNIGGDKTYPKYSGYQKFIQHCGTSFCGNNSRT